MESVLGRWVTIVIYHAIYSPAELDIMSTLELNSALLSTKYP